MHVSNTFKELLLPLQRRFNPRSRTGSDCRDAYCGHRDVSSNAPARGHVDGVLNNNGMFQSTPRTGDFNVDHLTF